MGGAFWWRGPVVVLVEQDGRGQARSHSDCRTGNDHLDLSRSCFPRFVLLITIPPLVMYIFFNRQIVAGMTSGAVKG